MHSITQKLGLTAFEEHVHAEEESSSSSSSVHVGQFVAMLLIIMSRMALFGQRC